MGGVSPCFSPGILSLTFFIAFACAIKLAFLIESFSKSILLFNELMLLFNIASDFALVALTSTFESVKILLIIKSVLLIHNLIASFSDLLPSIT